MKVKNLFPLALLILFSLSLTAAASDFSVNAEKSKVVWIGTKVAGSHTGEIRLAGGKLKVEKSELLGGEINVDMTSITTTDLSGEWADKLIGHLKSDDFFSVKKHKVANFKISKVSKAKKGKVTLMGSLTIKGKSHPAKFIGTIRIQNKNLEGKGRLEFDRTKYNIRYGSGKFFQGLGDKMIHDKVILDIEIKARG